MKIFRNGIFSGVMLGGVVLSGVMGCVTAGAQTHKVAKPENVVRAVGVYEWTGDLTKASGSRLVPVTLFVDGKLEDAGVYMARPIPMAVLNGNVYELQVAGVGKGLLDLAYARHLTSTAYDDGWFGYGAFKADAPAKKAPALRQSKTLATVTTGSSADKPHFATKDESAKDGAAKDGGSDAGGPGKSGSSASTGDPDRPTMKRRSDDTGSDTASAKSDSSAPTADPDRPTMKRRTDDNGSGTDSAGSSTASTGSVSADDPDRPTLKRRSPDEAKKAQREANMSSVTAVGSLNDDPNRPTIHRGKPVSSMTVEDLPPLKGLPADVHQMVAVSDAVDRPQHDFSRAWENDQERAAVLAKMETIARAELAGYGVTPAAANAAPVVKKTATTTSKARSTKKPAAPPPVEPLLDEDLKGYVLSYGGLPTYVFQAHTDGDGAALKYVTVVAQTDGVGEMHTAIKSVTDAAHLDRTPRMRLVDAVDVEASNRASLLFELREQNSRQFALYRVIGARSDQIFLTGTTQ